MPAKRKNIQKGNGKNSQGKKTKVESNPEERVQQDNGSNTNERISCKCNKLWVQKRLLTHIKRDSNCRSKYTEEEIEAIAKVSSGNAAQKRKLNKIVKRKQIEDDKTRKENIEERISCKCNQLWEQSKLLKHIKKDSKCRSKYTEDEIEAITKEMQKVQKQKNSKRKKIVRANIKNDKEKQKVQKQKNSERMKIVRANIKNDVRKRLITFRRECQYGPIFTCICCMRDLFRKTVKKVTAAYMNFLNSNGMAAECLQIDENGDLKNDLKVHGDHYICQNCCRYLQKGEMPLICAKNGLEYSPIPNCLQIENLERQMICKDLVFIKIRHLPSYSRMPAINDHVINVPIDDDDIIKTVTSLPRTQLTNGLVTVGLKRDMAIKKFHKLQLIRPDKICEAISYLKEKHPSYANIDILSLDEWRKQFYAEECDDTENTGENTEDDSSNTSQIVEEASEKSIYNFATCLIPDNPLSDVVGKNIF